MGDIRNEPNQDVLFVLQYEEETLLELSQEPINWDEGSLEIVRNKLYHGIITEFTDALEFENEAKDFILSAYSNGGINANLYLIKYEKTLNDNYVGNDQNISWNLIYRGIADFTSMQEKKSRISMNFNSDELEQLLKTHESDAFDIERLSSINARIGVGGISGLEEDLSQIQFNEVTLRPRNILGKGVATNEYPNAPSPPAINGRLSRFKIPGNDRISIPTVFISKGFGRHVEVTDHFFATDRANLQPNMFYDDLLIEENHVVSSLKITMNIDILFHLSTGQPNTNSVKWRIQQFKFEEGIGYVEDNSFDPFILNIGEDTPNSNNFTVEVNSTTVGGNVVTIPMGMPYNYAYAMFFEVISWDSSDDTPNFNVEYSVNEFSVQVEEVSQYNQESNEKQKFAFVNEVGERLMEIITGKKNSFYSKLFGRKYKETGTSTGLITQYQDPIYDKTGEFGLVGLIHGMSVRRFNSNEHELYKPLSMSMKELITSLQATFNIGVGIERGLDGDRVRFEKLEYFYQDNISVILPSQISDVSRKVDASFFNSACDFGSEKGGDYENEIGLDEPNTKSKFTTPLRKTENKYTKMSLVRSDDYGREVLRRKPAYIDEQADMQGDEDKWYLDLRQDPSVGFPMYEQRKWNDVTLYNGTIETWLQELPQGVGSPETYQSWLFTPKRSFFRHGWVMRAGMEAPIIQSQSFILSEAKANINLVTQMYNEPLRIIEKQPERTSSLERPRVLPEIIKFKHPSSPELRNLIFGTTAVEVEGVVENLPNWYFKFQWVNENEEVETGYLRSYKEKSDEFEFIKANENIIF